MNNIEALVLYFLVVIISSLLLYIAKKYRTSRGIFLIFITLAIAIPSAFLSLKYTTLHNADYGRYIIVSEEISKISLTEYVNLDAAYKMETSFWFMSKISWTLSSSPFLMFSLYYILTLIFFVGGIFSSKTLSPFRSAIVYIFLLATIIPLGVSGIRSLLSISILYFAAISLINGKNKKFYILSILSALFHNLSIVASFTIYILFKFFKGRQTSWKKITILLIAPLILLYIFSSITYGDLLGFLEPIPVLNKYQDYQSVLQLNEKIISPSSITIYNAGKSVFMSLLLVYSFYVYLITTKKYQAVSVTAFKLIVLSIIGILLGSVEFVSRVSSFMAPFLIMAIYELIPENNRTSLYITPAILAYSIGFFIVFVFIADHTGFFPLHFIWEYVK